MKKQVDKLQLTPKGKSDFTNQFKQINNQKISVSSFGDLYLDALHTPFKVQDIDEQIGEKLSQLGKFVLNLQAEVFQLILACYNIPLGQFSQKPRGYNAVLQSYTEFQTLLKTLVAEILINQVISNHLATLSEWLVFAKEEVLSQITLPFMKKDNPMAEQVFGFMKVSYDYDKRQVLSTTKGDSIKTILQGKWPSGNKTGMPLLKKSTPAEVKKGLGQYSFIPSLSTGVQDHLSRNFATWYVLGLAYVMADVADNLQCVEQLDFDDENSTLLDIFFVSAEQIYNWKNTPLFSSDGLQSVIVHLPDQKHQLNPLRYDSVIEFGAEIMDYYTGEEDNTNLTIEKRKKILSTFFTSGITINPFVPILSHKVGTSHRVNILHRGDGMLKDLICLGYIDFNNFKNYTSTSVLELLIEETEATPK